MPIRNDRPPGKRIALLGHWVKAAGINVLGAFRRYPLPAVCIVALYILFALSVSQGSTPRALLLTLLVTLFAGLCANALSERFNLSTAERIFLNILAALLGGGYYLLSFDSLDTIGYAAGVRTSVLLFSLFCLFLWIPSLSISKRWKYETKTPHAFPFYGTVMACFKNFFISVLYTAVACLGVLLIHTAVSLLLYTPHSDVLLQLLLFVSVLCGPLYLLTTIPRFHSEREAQRTEDAARCPRFLEVLISYIVIPLMALLTLVFVIYLLKILITAQWPSGQIGALVLSYSAIGLAVHTLCGLLENRIARLYQRLFPAFLVPLVIMQIVSVVIRLRAYGLTESRYYVLLAALFSLIAALILSNAKKNGGGGLFLFAAVLAILSIIPPFDAFTVSRKSQTMRMESILAEQGMLSGRVLTPKAAVSDVTGREITNISTYLYDRGYTETLIWLPDSFNPYLADNEAGSFFSVFGFQKQYAEWEPDTGKSIENLNVSLAPAQKNPGATLVSGFDVFVGESYFYRSMDTSSVIAQFTLDGQAYRLLPQLTDTGLPQLLLQTEDGSVQLRMALSEAAMRILDVHENDTQLSEEEMTVVYLNEAMRAHVVFRYIHATKEAGDLTELSFSCQVLVDIR